MTVKKKSAVKKKVAAKNKPVSKRKVGRPTSYRDEYAEQAYKLCLLGATDKELADFFEVSEQTLNAWKHKVPKFLESLKRGKLIADAEVAEKLYQRALGYSHPEDKIFNDQGKPLIVPTVKQYPPDAGAAKLWLINRQGNKWRDKTDVNHGGQKDNPIQSLIREVSGNALPIAHQPEETTDED